MNEADMERLVRDHPEELLGEKLRLVSQQETFRSGITNLIFEDAQGDVVVVELKRGVLQREHVAQVIDYLEDVETRYKGRNVELMVVANVIPSQRRAKLERLGVTFCEVPEARFREIARAHGVELSEAADSPLAGTRSGSMSGDRMSIRPECERTTVAQLVTKLIDYGERFVSGLGRNLKQDLENSDYGWLSSKAYAQLSRWCHPNRYTDREAWVQPIAHQISTLLFGSVIHRTAHPSYGS